MIVGVANDVVEWETPEVPRRHDRSDRAEPSLRTNQRAALSDETAISIHQR